ncbi:hypothetical protein ABZT03_38200 [Streptomyces sp. NPDC005574]|uniref:hypothetical protein n=1 Tax=Streptomyces sp. NPDC005574 TaxID=3156891 RepID=UPI0033A51C71
MTKPYCVKYWQHGLGWKFELCYEHGVSVNHDRLIDHLTSEVGNGSSGEARLLCLQAM